MQLENQGEHDRGHVHRADLLCALDFDATSLKRGEERRGEERRGKGEGRGGRGGKGEKIKYDNCDSSFRCEYDVDMR